TASASATTTLQELQKIVSKVNYDESLASVFLSDSISAQQIKNTIENLNRSSKGIDSVLINLNEVILEIKNGKGTLDYMVNDTLLVKNIEETMNNLKDGSVKLNENLEALKHNFLFRGYFKKIERQKRKAEKNKN
ncbi:MAG: MCE family protein, partial [Flavobacteriaceae bacterium]|nr:MCE family protein [Flavobacteriaceae bacterium]